MMKKCLVLVLALLLVCAAALAEESTRVEFADTFALTRPADLGIIELGEDEASEGMVYAALNDELEMYMWAYDLDGATAEEIYKNFYADDEFFEDIKQASAGDFVYSTHMIVDEGPGAIFVCPDGMYYELVFYCETDAAIEQAQAVLASIEAI